MDGQEDIEQTPRGRDHILPTVGDSLGYWLKIIIGGASIVTIIVTLTAFILGLGTQLSVLQTRVDAQDVRITKNSETLDKVYDALSDIKADIAAIKIALHVKD